jgi:hypothetical protein
MAELIKLAEPTLLFGHGQAMEDPRDGLTLFGPLDEGMPYGIRAGVLGTKEGIGYFEEWVKKIQGPISNDPPERARPMFPGFKAAFGIPWTPEPSIRIEIPADEIHSSVRVDDKHQRVYKTVDCYSRRILDALRKEDISVDIWFLIIPDEVYKYCRPMSEVEEENRIHAEFKMSAKAGRRGLFQRFIFEQQESVAEQYQYDINFHNQLKARVLGERCPTQIIKESTLAHWEYRNKFGEPVRKLDQQQSAIAWNISSVTFYKTGGRPWKVGTIREGVCYIGLVFKKDERFSDKNTACCAAQMFLDSGDGVVFKGAVGPWYEPESRQFHLSRNAARELVEVAIKSYADKRGEPPRELFLHGKVRFDNEEWKGFEGAVDSPTNLVGVRIRPDSDLKLYRKGKHPVLRGLAYVRDERTAYLWTKGFTPRLQTYPGREVPNPLLIDVCKGKANIETVLGDILALTKLNYNSCIFADGMPVTLTFADAVGEILTAGPIENVPPLQFKYYI